ncbi:MAG: hypothetical protein WA919_23585 [Coleofasciculaceae cyanobacterium]
MGLQKREEVDAAIAGIQQGQLTAEELDYLNLYGDLHRHQLNFTDIPSEKLLYRSR